MGIKESIDQYTAQMKQLEVEYQRLVGAVAALTKLAEQEGILPLSEPAKD